jgi:hypothetical protein
LREWQSGERGTAPLYPSKAADTCQDILKHFAFSIRSQGEGTEGSLARISRSELSLGPRDNPWCEKAEIGKLARRSRLDRPEFPTLQSWPMQFPPNRLFSCSFCFSTSPKLPTVLTNALTSLFFWRAISSCHSFNIVLLPSLHTTTTVKLLAPCRSLATILALSHSCDSSR